MKKFKLLWQTIKYLKLIQIRYRLFYFVRGKLRRLVKHKQNFTLQPKETVNLTFDSQYFFGPASTNNTFTFLNKEKSFSAIDWDFEDFGKLWAYNLNYFEYVVSPDGKNVDHNNSLIEAFIADLKNRRNGLEPYPTSLRGINWVKYFSAYHINRPAFDNALYVQYNILLQNLEYHILGNHLLENGFSLLFGAYYFNDNRLFKQANKIITTELEEQTLQDGAHFELSPMYHQIILYRVLDCIQLLQKNKGLDHDDRLLSFLTQKASLMLGWLQNITFSDGTIPMVNDAAFGIAPDSTFLLDYAQSLEVGIQKTVLSASGYRKINTNGDEWLVDIGQVGPSYQPGHAHSDILNTLLHVDGAPFLTEVGTSTYDKDAKRQQERSTSSHNTSQLDNFEQSEVWGGFRVARRAKCTVIMDTISAISASHNGYQSHGITAKRSWSFQDKEVVITDELLNNTDLSGFTYWHIHPDRSIKQIDEQTIQIDHVTLQVKGAEKVTLENYDFANGYYQSLTGTKIIIHFTSSVSTHITKS